MRRKGECSGSEQGKPNPDAQCKGFLQKSLPGCLQ